VAWTETMLLWNEAMLLWNCSRMRLWCSGMRLCCSFRQDNYTTIGDVMPSRCLVKNAMESIYNVYTVVQTCNYTFQEYGRI